MAGSPGLIRWRLLALALVLGGHALALEGLARLREPAVLRNMVPPMYTRMLKPEVPPPVVASAAPAPVVQAAPRRAAVRAIPARPAASQRAMPEALPAAEREVAEVAAPPAAPPVEPAAPAAPASPAEAVPVPVEAAAAPPLPGWPADTRLSYRVGGQFRSGDLHGDARVQWQREGERYQVRVDIDITLWATLVMTSQGAVTPQGLAPGAYEELRPGKRRGATFGPELLALENGKSAPRPPGMQDTASQFVELAHRFATGRDVLAVGNSVSIWLARPGAVDRWTYDVVERETLQTPNLGALDTYRLKPRPLANPRGNITAEMWFAPGLQYLPVRIKVNMGEAYVDLLVDQIEQR